MQSPMGKALAIAEVVTVFVLTFVAIWALALLPVERTVRWFLAYGVMIAVPLLAIFVPGRDPAAYGLAFRPVRDHLQAALNALIPVALCSALEGWLIPAMLPNAAIRPEGAAVFLPIEVACLLGVAWMLRDRPRLAASLPMTGALVILAQTSALPGDRLGSFVFYSLFLGPGEEILFRGYIQSRLNGAFGRPRHWLGSSWGWGLIGTCLLFGLMHVLNPFNPFQGQYSLYPWWGVWTCAAGLVFGYVREKTGSVFAPALLHGVPQAIASLFFGFFSVR